MRQTFKVLLPVALAVAAVTWRVSAHANVVTLPRTLTSHPERVIFNAPSLAPMAHTRFCLQYPQDCEIRRSFRRGPVAMTAERWDELQAVNRQVNRAIVPQRNYGGVATEEWLVSPRTGDCNDYAVTKQHELLARGWPSGALLLSEVVVSWGEHHLVLVVRTAQGDVLLDNLSSNVRPVAAANYRWVRTQMPSNPKFWSTVRIAKPVAVTASLAPSKPRLLDRTALALRARQSEPRAGDDRNGASEEFGGWETE